MFKYSVCIFALFLGCDKDNDSKDPVLPDPGPEQPPISYKVVDGTIQVLNGTDRDKRCTFSAQIEGKDPQHFEDLKTIPPKGSLILLQAPNKITGIKYTCLEAPETFGIMIAMAGDEPARRVVLINDAEHSQWCHFDNKNQALGGYQKILSKQQDIFWNTHDPNVNYPIVGRCMVHSVDVGLEAHRGEDNISTIKNTNNITMRCRIIAESPFRDHISLEPHQEGMPVKYKYIDIAPEEEIQIAHLGEDEGLIQVAVDCLGSKNLPLFPGIGR